MAWLWLAVAALLEIPFAVMLKLSDGFTRPFYTAGFLITTLVSFYCLTRAMQTIPMGTAYAIWTGVGAAGVILIGIFYFDEPVTLLRLSLLLLLAASVVGLKVTSSV